MTVIATFELDDLVAPGRCPRDPNSTHRRLGPGIHEPNPFERGHEPTNVFAQSDFEFGRCAEARSAAGGLFKGSRQATRRVAVDERSP